MHVRYSKSARKDLRKLPAKDCAAILAKFETYAKTGIGDVKKLTGRNDFRLRHGQWRAIFEMVDGILVVQVLHRNTAYK